MHSASRKFNIRGCIKIYQTHRSVKFVGQMEIQNVAVGVKLCLNQSKVWVFSEKVCELRQNTFFQLVCIGSIHLHNIH